MKNSIHYSKQNTAKAFRVIAALVSLEQQTSHSCNRSVSPLVMKYTILSLERRLAKSPDLKSQYIECTHETIEANHMVRLGEGEISSKYCFLLHHHVINYAASDNARRGSKPRRDQSCEHFERVS